MAGAEFEQGDACEFGGRCQQTGSRPATLLSRAKALAMQWKLEGTRKGFSRAEVIVGRGSAMPHGNVTDKEEEEEADEEEDWSRMQALARAKQRAWKNEQMLEKRRSAFFAGASVCGERQREQPPPHQAMPAPHQATVEISALLSPSRVRSVCTVVKVYLVGARVCDRVSDPSSLQYEQSAIASWSEPRCDASANKEQVC